MDIIKYRLSVSYCMYLLKKQKMKILFFLVTSFQTQILSNFLMVTWVSEVKNAVPS